MKRFIYLSIFVLTLAFITINFPGIKPAHSETQGAKVDVYDRQKLVKSVVFAIGINEYYVNDTVPGIKMDARPYIKEGRTFVPVRYLGYALGAAESNISWNESQKKAVLRLGQNSVEMVIGVPKITANGNTKDIDVSPMLNETEGRTYLPARYIAEGLGFDVGWDDKSQTVLCWPRGEAKPDVSAVVNKVLEERAKVVTSMGYVVPSPGNTRMRIEDKSQDVNLTLMIYLPSSEYAKKRLPQDQWITKKDFETQFTQAEEILASKHGREVAKAVVDYARKKTTRETELETKEFPLPEGGEIEVQGVYNAGFIAIQIWRV